MTARLIFPLPLTSPNIVVSGAPKSAKTRIQFKHEETSVDRSDLPTLIYRPASSAEHTVWIEVVDQFNRAITGADVLYCQDEACRHQYNDAPDC